MPSKNPACKVATCGDERGKEQAEDNAHYDAEPGFRVRHERMCVKNHAKQGTCSDDSIGHSPVIRARRRYMAFRENHSSVDG